MASLLDLLQSGQLGTSEPLPAVLAQIIQAAKGSQAVSGNDAGAPTPLPGVAVSQPPMGMVPPMPPTVDATSRPQVGEPYAPPPAAPVTTAAVPSPTPKASVPNAADIMPKGGFFDVLEGMGRSVGMNIPDRVAQNATAQALLKQGVDPEIVKAAVLNPQLMPAALATAFPDKFMKTAPGEDVYQRTGDPNNPLKKLTGDEMTDKTLPGRVLAAAKLGLTPNTREWQAYIMNGKLPDVVPDHAAIRDADAKVLSSKHLLEDLGQAMSLSKTLTGGLAAKAAPGLELVGGTENSRAVTTFNNIVQNSILPSLKQTFGARVTNADLSLMKELAGAASQSQQVREDILRRAMNRAQEIQAENTTAAKQLREGNFYKPGGGAPSAMPAPPDASQATATKVINGKTYMQIGGQWYQQ